MSRKILELNEWIVLYYYDYETPFWGKPPLSFWASAASMWAFGVNEFGARFAPFFFGLLCCGLFFAWIFRRNDGESWALRPIACAVILSTTGIGFVASGAVMTDEALLFCVMLCMISFWRCCVGNLTLGVGNSFLTQDTRITDNFNESSLRCARSETISTKQSKDLPKNNHITLFGYLFFVGLGLGLLAKGPLIFVLVGLPISAFLFIVRCFTPYTQILHLKNLPFFSGTALMLLIALPWYIAFEVKSEGFLEYFIIGEHFKRFFVSGWEGDLYGNAHSQPIGTIWWFFFISFLPWSVVFLGFVAKKIYGFFKIRKDFGVRDLAMDSARIAPNPANIENLYLALWILMPLCFLTFSRNILEAYTLPCAPAFCILMTNFIFGTKGKFSRGIWLLPLSLMLILCAFLASGKLDSLVDSRHQKDIFTRWDGEGRIIFLDAKPSFSGYFYAHQSAKKPFKDEFLSLKSPQISAILDSNEKICIAMKERDYLKNKERFGNFAPIVAKKEWILLKNLGSL
ncbi:ArnT family glycosyltransferase [Helicobacter sp. T3_23-1056]